MKSFLTYFFPVVFLAIFSLPSQPDYRRTSDIKCSPEELKSAFAVDVFSVRDGDWHSGSTWSNGKVPAEDDRIVMSHNLTSRNNVIIRGKLTARKAKLTFLGINENSFVGSFMGPEDTPGDIGLWVMGGELDLQGDQKTSWTRLLGSALKGALSITVSDASGWKPGDEIFVVPTDTPNINDADWDDATNTGTDKFAVKFERRIITAITGNTISFASPLLYDHLAVRSDALNKTWTAEVGNISRSIIIEGTKTGRSHIFIRSNRAQTIKNIEGRYLGPRKTGGRGFLVNGRYGLHFHHCMDGSIGSIVEGNAFHDIGNRVYVPHMSNGILFKNNISFAQMEASFWWDFQDQSHSITYDGNLAALRVNNGTFGGSVGFELGQGDDNKVINNVVVYQHYGSDPHQQGGFAWNTNNVGVWVFVNNLSHSNITGLFVWQNVPDNHVNEDYWSYNNVQGIHHGAYINSYMYRGGGHVNSLVKFEAIQGNTVDLFQNVGFDGQNKLDYLVEVITSPNRGYGGLLNCTFVGYKKSAVLMNTSIFTGEPIAGKAVGIVMPKGNTTSLTAFSPTSIYDSYFMIQPVSGQSYQVSQSGRTDISPFASTVYGTGNGLKAKYLNGKDFNSLAFERVDPMLKFQQWSVDFEQSPDGVHHKINPVGPFSVVWEGYYEPQYSGQHQFAFESFGGVRLYLDNALIFQRWTENQDRVIFDAPLVALQLGKKYKLKIEHFNEGGERGIQLFTKQGGSYKNVPPSQLYTESGIIEPPPANRPPVVSAGIDRLTRDTVLKVEGTASDPDGNIQSVTWTGPAGVTLEQTLSEAAHVMVKAKPGTYTLRITAKDKLNLTAFDEMVLNIQPPPVDTTTPPPVTTDSLVSRAGPDQSTNATEVTFDGSKSTGKISAINWFHESGPASWNLTNQNGLITKANRLVKGTYVFRLRLKDAAGNESNDYVTAYVGSVTPPPTFINKALTDTCTNGSILTVPAGKYTASSQALADTLALQDMNVQLAKCEVPYAVFTLPDGRKLYIFGNSEPYKFIIK